MSVVRPYPVMTFMSFCVKKLLPYWPSVVSKCQCFGKWNLSPLPISDFLFHPCLLLPYSPPLTAAQSSSCFQLARTTRVLVKYYGTTLAITVSSVSASVTSPGTGWSWVEGAGIFTALTITFFFWFLMSSLSFLNGCWLPDVCLHFVIES